MAYRAVGDLTEAGGGGAAELQSVRFAECLLRLGTATPLRACRAGGRLRCEGAGGTCRRQGSSRDVTCTHRPKRIVTQLIFGDIDLYHSLAGGPSGFTLEVL